MQPPGAAVAKSVAQPPEVAKAEPPPPLEERHDCLEEFC